MSTPVRSEREVSSGPGGSDRPLEALRALVVDDNANVRRCLVRRLRSWGARVDTADGGAAALRLARYALEAGDPYRLALVDRCMPPPDCRATVRALRKLGHDGAIIAMSGKFEHERECLEAGADLFLAKPFRRGALRGAIAATCGARAKAGRQRHPVECPVLMRLDGRNVVGSTAEVSAVELLISSEAPPVHGATLGLRLIGLGAVLRVSANPRVELAGEVVEVRGDTFLVRLSGDVTELEGILRRAQLS